MRADSSAVIGLGDTGRTVACRLLRNGCDVVVHDEDPQRSAAMVAAGARPARLAADAAESAAVVFVAVRRRHLLEDVLFDCGGVGETLPEGGFVVLACGEDPAWARSAAARLADLGLRTVEAWVRDGLPGSEVGAEPLLLAGSPEDVAAIAPALSMRGFDHVCVGGLGVIAALRQGLGALDRLRSAVVADRLRHRLAEAWSEAETTLPPGGASAIDELGDAVDAALGSGWEARLHVAPPVLGPVGNCLGVGDAEFEEVVEQLERRCRIPLLREALICDTPLDLVRLLHAQTTSAV